MKMKKILIVAIIVIILIRAATFYREYISPAQRRNVLVESTLIQPFGSIQSVGSGTIISDCAILTAKHCLEDMSRIRITLPDNDIIEVEKYYLDPNNDIGLIFVNTYSSDVEFNDYVDFDDFIYCIGNSSGVWRNYVFFGIVYDNFFKRLATKDKHYILARMEVKPGASGGGVYHKGKLIGIVSRRSPGATLIVPAEICEKFYKKILEKRRKETLDLINDYLSTNK